MGITLFTLLMSVLVCLSCQVHAQLIEYSMTHQINLGLSDVIIRDNGDYLFTASAISPTYDSIMALTILTNSSFEVQQVNRYKSLNEDDFSCALQLSNGNYLVAGAMRQNFNTTEGAGFYMLNEAGEVLLSRRYTEEHDDRMLEMYEQSDSTWMFFVREGVNNKPTKIFHVNNQGDILSQRIYLFDNIGVFAETVCADGLGAYYMCGRAWNMDTQTYDLFVCAVNDQQMLWYKTFGFGRDVTCYANTFEPGGDLVIAGNIVDAQAELTSNTFILRLDSNGDYQSCFEYYRDETLTEFVYDIHPDGNGNVIVSGQYYTLEGADGLLYKVDGDGNVLWAHRYEGTGYDGVGWFRVLPDGKLLISAASGYKWLLIADSDGNSACSSYDVPLLMNALTPSIMTSTPDADTPDMTAITPDYQIMADSVTTAELCTSTLIDSPFTVSDWTLYPSPAGDYLNIAPGTLKHDRNEAIITNALGSIVMRKSLDLAHDRQLRVAHLPPGVYYLTLLNDDRVVGTQAFVKE